MNMNIPVEIWAIILSHVDDFDSLLNANLICKQWHRLLCCEADYSILYRAIKGLDSSLRPTKRDTRNRINKNAGTWWNAGLRYKLTTKNMNTESKVNVSRVQELDFLNKIPNDFDQIEVVAEFNRRVITPRSITHQKQGYLIFSAQIDVSDGVRRICYPMVNFKNKNVKIHRTKVEGFPDFEVSDEKLIEYEPTGNIQRQWLNEHLNTGSNRSHYEYLDLDEDDSMMVNYGTSARFHKYELRAARPGEKLWAVDITIKRDTAGLATVLATKDYVLIIENTLRVYRIKDKRLLLTCDVSELSSQVPMHGGFAVTQTHLLAINDNLRKVLAVSISDLLKHQSADTQHWSCICDFSAANSYNLEAVKFSEKRFRDRFITLVFQNAMCLIDLYKGDSCIYISDITNDMAFGFQTVRLTPRSSCHWVIDNNGKIVYISQQYLSEITYNYNKKECIDVVGLDEL